MKPSISPRSALLGRLSLDTRDGPLAGDARIRLLEEIEREGAIARAAKRVPLSYKAAWEAVEAMNNLAPLPLVERAVGGHRGGGARLTEQGRRLVAMYRAIEAESQRMLEGLAQAMQQAPDHDPGKTLALLRSLHMKVSARNQLAGTITALREGAVNFEVRLRIDADNELVANITKESAQTLELTIGKDVVALIKASSPLLMTDRNVRTSARNQLWGKVTTIHAGAVNSEVNLTLPSQRTLTAIVTDDSVRQLHLKVGSAVCAVIKASDVILATFD